MSLRWRIKVLGVSKNRKHSWAAGNWVVSKVFAIKVHAPHNNENSFMLIPGRHRRRHNERHLICIFNIMLRLNAKERKKTSSKKKVKLKKHVEVSQSQRSSAANYSLWSKSKVSNGKKLKFSRTKAKLFTRSVIKIMQTSLWCYQKSFRK